MPHRVQMQIIKRRLVGKEGAERVRELRAILAELPGYKSGPYADVRKWVNEELARTRVRKRTVHRDSLAVPREGAAQVALVGFPNAGKSSLLQALSEIQIHTADYPFTTLRPVAAVTRIRDVRVQLVEIPGLLPGAHEGRGGGRALLGVLRAADAIVYCHAAGEPIATLSQIRDEVAAAGISKPTALAVTKADEADDRAAREIGASVPDLPVTAVSILDDGSLEAFRETVWGLTGLIRVYTRKPGETTGEPLAIPVGSSVTHVARALHGELADVVRGARVWGPSARFPGQRVGPALRVSDGDIVELLTSR